MAIEISSETIGAFPAKDPGSALDYLYDFTNLLTVTESIVSIDAVVADPTDLTITGSSIAAGAKSVVVLITGGLPGRTYTVTVTVTTDEGGPPVRTFERSCLLPVRDR